LRVVVVGADGTPTPVLGIYRRAKDVYRVSAQDGASTLCCGEHLWTVRTHSDKRRGKPRTLQTRT
jgi:phosphate starvation-inducible PhoH-like protein